jgi:hypothetical protein
MKRIIVLLLFTAFTAGFSLAQKPVKPTVIVYYFHITERCGTCIRIEQETTKLLNSAFEEELKKGSLVFKEINVDLEENNAIKTKYHMYGSGLLLVKPLKKGEKSLELTNEAFQFVPGNVPKFRAVLKTEIEKMIKDS